MRDTGTTIVIIAPLSDAYEEVQADLYNLSSNLVRQGKHVLLFGRTRPDDMDGLHFVNPIHDDSVDPCRLLREGRGGEIVKAILQGVTRFVLNCDRECELIINGAGSRLADLLAQHLELPVNRFYMIGERHPVVHSIARFDPHERDASVALWEDLLNSARESPVDHCIVWMAAHQRNALAPVVQEMNACMIPFASLVAA